MAEELGPRALSSGLKYATAVQGVLATTQSKLLIAAAQTVITHVPDPTTAKCYQDMMAYLTLAQGRCLEFIARSDAQLKNLTITPELQGEFSSIHQRDAKTLSVIQQSIHDFDARRQAQDYEQRGPLTR
jgi:hypothetical protein